MTTNFPINSENLHIKKFGVNVKIIINMNGKACISNRTLKRSGCPFCYKVRVFKTPKKN